MCSISSPIPSKVPERWRSLADAWAGPRMLDVAGLSTSIDLTEEALSGMYLPVLASLAGRAEGLARARPRSRLIVGLGGVPGAGKSVFAAVLAHLAEQAAARIPHGVVRSGWMVTVGMDGWHLPEAVLAERWTNDADGRRAPLRDRKGGPESFDVPALAAALRELREAGREMHLPVYDRRRHDVVPGALVIPAVARVIFIEGNYLLCTTPPWNEVAGLLDSAFFLACDPAVARARVIARHVAGGLDEAHARRKYETNDAHNARFVEPSIARADYILGP